MISVDREGVWATGDDRLSASVAACRVAHAEGYFDLAPIQIVTIELIENSGGNDVEREFVQWLAEGAIEFLNEQAPSGYVFDWEGNDRLTLAMRSYE
jgi:hypothetical protein